METLPEPQDPIKSWLSWFMSGEDVVRYSDLSYVLETIKKDGLCWQAAVSLGAHALGWGVWGKTDEERAENVVGRALEPLEALHESLTRQGGQEPLTEEQGRMLFHVRFGLGFLLWVKGDHERAKRVLHDMAATSLSWSRGWHRSGGGLLTYTHDIGAGKEVTALVMSLLYPEVEDYDEALYLVEQAADTPGHGSAALVLADDLLDRWAAKCEAIEQQQGAGRLDGWNEWTSLLHRAAEVLSVCEQVDTSGVLPGDRDEASAQFFAYKFGQLAARFAAGNAVLWREYMAESDEPSGVDFLVEALLCDLEGRPDWHRLRDRCLTGWQRAPVYEGTSVTEIGPHMDLYWAMRIGFADKMLESTRALAPAGQPAAPPGIVRDIETIKEVVTTTAIRLVKERHAREQRLPPTKEDIEQCLRERLGNLWDNLPSDVTDALLSAEYGYRAGWQSAIPTGAVLKGFHEAVEACLGCYFTKPFATYLNKGRLSHTTVCWGVWRDQPQRQEFHADNPRCLSLGRWAGVFERVAHTDFSGKENVRVGAFVKQNWPDLGVDGLRQLAASLRGVQRYRNRAVHPQSPPRPHHAEKAELDDMRKLVLDTDGDGSSSIIAQIYRLLGPSRQS